MIQLSLVLCSRYLINSFFRIRGIFWGYNYRFYKYHTCSVNCSPTTWNVLSTTIVTTPTIVFIVNLIALCHILSEYNYRLSITVVVSSLCMGKNSKYNYRIYLLIYRECHFHTHPSETSIVFWKCRWCTLITGHNTELLKNENVIKVSILLGYCA